MALRLAPIVDLVNLTHFIHLENAPPDTALGLRYHARNGVEG